MVRYNLLLYEKRERIDKVHMSLFGITRLLPNSDPEKQGLISGGICSFLGAKISLKFTIWEGGTISYKNVNFMNYFEQIGHFLASFGSMSDFLQPELSLHLGTELSILSTNS